MNTLRIATNFVLATALFIGAAYLAGQQSIAPGDELKFSGASLYMLAASMAFLGLFAAAVGYGWATGAIEMPNPDKMYVNPKYKKALLERFWYLLLPAVILFTTAIFLAYLF